MKKLKNKVLYTIFVILTLFVLTIVLLFNHQIYNQEKRKIDNNLRINSLRIRDDITNRNIRFIDSNIYTAILDSNYNIVTIVSHTEDGNVSEEIKNEFNNIDINKKEKIGNLYFNKYSYRISKNKRITLVDNTQTNQILKKALYITLIAFLLIEIVLYLIADLLSKWIIKPVEESFEKQKQFIADASHELKTPLSVIMASSEALQKDNDKKWINNIESESERMNKLITNLLDLSKIENNNSFENVNLSKLVEKTTLTLESLMYEKDIKLETNIEENVIFNCNSDEFKQLISILLDNAIKHSDKKGIIKVNLYLYKSTINIEVINKGDKIPEEEEEKIFERFYRIDKARNRKENRYGLGLAIAKSIVEKHNGSIKAKSDNGFTTFKIEIKK